MSTAPSTPVKPICYYNFEKVNGKLTDLSGNGYDATVPTSGVHTTNDPVMGVCQQFDGTTGNFIKIDNLPASPSSDPESFKGLTMTTWIYVTDTTQNCSVIQIGTSENGYAQLIITGTTLTYRRWGNGSAGHANIDNKISTEKWMHLAVTVDEHGETTIYIDGSAPSPYPTKNTNLKADGDIGWNYVTLGSDGTQTTAPVFKGKMAWAGFYRGAMQAPEIQAEMALGQSNRQFVSNRSFPVDFKLFSDDAGADSPILFIESAGNVDQMLDFHIVNTGNKPMSIPVGNGTINATSNYHFQLKFRPGILSDNYVTKHSKSSSGNAAAEPLLKNNSWSTLMTKDAANNDIMSFLYIGSTAMSLGSGEEVVLNLKKVNASATGGSKNTNVEFKYRGIDYGSTSPAKIEGYRKQNISIVNHTGDKNIPLRAEIIGTANVMTYHKSTGGESSHSELLFQLVNTGSEDLNLGLATSLEGATKLTLSVDIQPQSEFLDWALFEQGTGQLELVLDVIGQIRSIENGIITLKTPLAEALIANTQLQVNNKSSKINVTVNGSGAEVGAYTIPVQIPDGSTIDEGAYITPAAGLNTWKVESVETPPLPNQMQWTITNQSAQKFDPGEGLSFMLTGIECTLPTGTSTVTIGYSNIPGHWDGSFALPVQKSPVDFSQNLMGINTQSPDATLHIVAEGDNLPFRIQKPGGKSNAALPSSKYTLQQSLSGLQLLNKESQLFTDLTATADSSGNAKLNTWNPAAGMASIDLRQYSSSKANSIDNWDIAYEAPYLVINFRLEDIGYDVFKYSADTNGFTYCGNAIAIPEAGVPFAIYMGYLLVPQDQEDQVSFLCAYDLGSPFPSDPISVNTDPIGEMVVYGDNLYYYEAYYDDGITKIYKKSISLDGAISFGSKDSILSGTNPSHLFTLQGNKLYTVSGGPETSESDPLTICIIDLDNHEYPSRQFPLPQSVYDYFNNNHFGARIGVHNNFLYAPCATGVYIYDLSSPELYDEGAQRYMQFLAFDSSFSLSYLGMSGTYLWISDSSTTQLYDIQALLIEYAGQNTSISTKQISIGGLTPNAKAALSVSVDSASGMDAMAINDLIGNPIFNIKRPKGAGEPYCVGIGTDNPKAPLHVASSIPMGLAYYGFLNNSKKQNGSGYYDAIASAPSPVAIYTDQYIVAQQVCSVSDLRVKDVLNLSGPGQDLSTLLSLQVSDYQYIDFVGKGTGQKKGLIAQQVKELFPQAVSTENTDFIPDIYAMATDVGWQPITRHLRVSLEKAHDLKVGDIVRLIAEKGFEEKEVVAVLDDKSFVVAEWEKPVEKLFVFGKEVHDFHTVDYDQVAMLGVSAIQALHAEVETLKKEKEALKAQMTSEMAGLKEEWMAFKASMTKQYQN
ncbi:LamG-like jellyroll fold domain-containing protein [uncultured Roseivirga sp.]|uniref:LamG-like jellyroll fold domain-containing protein n=1 Tax=uncultured Roseivirga sp. TaxID=543088 RepID=UPI000D7B8BEB|nr:LamG-like jellyroll fold domain-containing protein [uncultured Roseivirga sp.]PWL31087.1 MAG: hypothetical protein DCO95_06325 [Roseivirga sp. XM-24bin3]